MTFIEIINTLIRSAFGLAVGFGALAFLWRRVATVRWQPLAEHYRRPSGTPRKVLRMQTLIILCAAPAYERYSGIVNVGVCERGVHLSLFPPWSLFHSPLFIPYSDISATKRRWFLLAAVEITARKAPQTKIVVYPELWQWIEEQANANAPVDDRYYSSSATPQLSLR